MGIIRIKQREAETDQYNVALAEHTIEKTSKIAIEETVTPKKKRLTSNLMIWF